MVTHEWAHLPQHRAVECGRLPHTAMGRHGDGPVMGKQRKLATAILFVITVFGLCVACGFACRFDLRARY
jgi:hypothetical protein